ncbi:hypothetical protein EW146_g7580 [Bondarzewia mesenterica]|uniref:Uncharacterized protein n=1 Tax=Bondarzewia mesenterica TaxID=1095465 RepID=A0A4S4LM94_9AGAM|nr:hypothetical protein EW146_g7580 [Bondarzewia mesenterica]
MMSGVDFVFSSMIKKKDMWVGSIEAGYLEEFVLYAAAVSRRLVASWKDWDKSGVEGITIESGPLCMRYILYHSWHAERPYSFSTCRALMIIKNMLNCMMHAIQEYTPKIEYNVPSVNGSNPKSTMACSAGIFDIDEFWTHLFTIHYPSLTMLEIKCIYFSCGTDFLHKGSRMTILKCIDQGKEVFDNFMHDLWRDLDFPPHKVLIITEGTVIAALKVKVGKGIKAASLKNFSENLIQSQGPITRANMMKHAGGTVAYWGVHWATVHAFLIEMLKVLIDAQEAIKKVMVVSHKVPTSSSSLVKVNFFWNEIFIKKLRATYRVKVNEPVMDVGKIQKMLIELEKSADDHAEI